MSEQGSTDAAEFLTPPTGDPAVDARMASEAAPPKAAKPVAADDAVAEGDEAFVGADDPEDDEGDEFDEAAAEDASADDETDKPEDFDEIEVSGKKHRIPKDLKPLLMMQQDYTRKTQEVAEQRKALENDAARVQAHMQSVGQQAELHRRVVGDIAELTNIDKAIQQYAEVDWNRLEAEDPMHAGTLFRQMSMLREKRQGIVQKISQADAQLQQERRQTHEAQQRVAREAFAKQQAIAATTFQSQYKLKPEVIKQVFDYAQEHGGYSNKELQDLADHRPIATLYKSYLWDQHVAKQKAAAKAKAPAPDIVRPLAPTPKGSTAPASRGLDDRLSAEEWARRRNEQLRGRR